MTVIDRQCAVDEEFPNADAQLARVHIVGARRILDRIKNEHVREIAWAQIAARVEAIDVGGAPGRLTNEGPQVDDLALADVTRIFFGEGREHAGMAVRPVG